MSDPCGNRMGTGRRLVTFQLERLVSSTDRRTGLQSVGQESNLHSARRVGYSHSGSPMPSRRIVEWHRRDSIPQTRRFELRRSASWRTVPDSRGIAVRRGIAAHSAPRTDFTRNNQKASPTGFEPVISTLTGWRALQAAPRGRATEHACRAASERRAVVTSKYKKMAQVGLEPTASLVLSQSGLPLPTEPSIHQCPRPESNRHPRGFKPSRSAGWRTWASSSPGWS